MKRLRWRRFWILLKRGSRSWWLGMLYWRNREPFRRESQIARVLMLALFLFVVLPLCQKSWVYGTLSVVLYAVLLGFVNYGLKKLSES